MSRSFYFVGRCRGVGPPAGGTWCLTLRKTLFFVVKHHVFGSEWASGHCHIQKVMHEPLFFCSMHQLHFSG